MSKVINLRLARKARKRAEAETGATASRALHGETKAQKQARKAEKERLSRVVDGAKRDD